jgi:hypothetical protein
MAERKYDKYIIHETPSSPLHPQGDVPWIPLMRIEDKVMKGAFYYECVWITAPVTERNACKPHSHSCDEILGFFGSNPKDPTNLNAEIEFWFDDEKSIFTKNTLVLVPAGVWHSPIFVSNLKAPVFCLSTSTATKYTQKVNRNSPWNHLADPMEFEL